MKQPQPYVQLLKTIHSSAGAACKEAGYAVGLFDGSISEAELSKLVASGTVALGVRSKPSVSAALIAAGRDLRAIGCYCVGTDKVDLEAASRRGIAVFNDRYSNTRSVAELVMANVINLFRQIPRYDHAMHAGVWTKDDDIGVEVRGKTIGIVGYGAIGSQVSVLAKALDMNVLYVDPDQKVPTYGRARRCSTLKALLEQADVVSLHVSLNETSRSLLDAAALAHMKPGSFLINASRGEVVDYDALAEALSSGHIAGAAVDVYTSEPGKKGDAFTHPLQNYETVILTPHIGGSTRESQVAIAQETSARLLDFLATGNTVGSVNLPEMPLGLVFSGRFRITNVHENVPGVIAAISECISQAGLNVAGMSLKTRGDVGYVAYDVETGDGAAVAKVCTAIDALSTTWRTTLLNNQGAGPPAPASQPE